MNVHVALLRGINGGGKNMLPMKDLAAMFTNAGCASVSTYIQSGNVVFEASPALSRRIPTLIEKVIADRFGYQVPVVTRSGAGLGKSGGGYRDAPRRVPGGLPGAGQDKGPRPQPLPARRVCGAWPRDLSPMSERL